MKTLTLNFSDAAWAAMELAQTQSKFCSVQHLAFDAVRSHTACYLEDLEEKHVSALFEEEPEPEPAATRVVSVELSPLGSALLSLIVAHDGYETEADALRGALAFVGGSLGEAIGRYHDEENLKTRLAPNTEEEDDEQPAAANRDDLPLAAAGKPGMGEGVSS